MRIKPIAGNRGIRPLTTTMGDRVGQGIWGECLKVAYEVEARSGGLAWARAEGGAR